MFENDVKQKANVHHFTGVRLKNTKNKNKKL